MQEDEFRAKYDELHVLATNIFIKHLVPIYLVEYKRAPKQFGSGCLIHVDSKNYLVTAAHSLMPEKGSEHERGVPFIYVDKNVMFRLENFAYSLPDVRGKNKYDIAVARLDENIKNRLFASDGLKKEALSTDNILPKLVPRERNHYSVCGYQSSKNRSRPSNFPIEPKSTSFSGNSPGLEVYKSLNLQPTEHLLIDVPTEANRKNQMPGLTNGMSGGPVFAFGRGEVNWKDVQHGLVGVVTHHLPVKNLFKATDIGAALKLISKYDDVVNKGKFGINID